MGTFDLYQILGVIAPGVLLLTCLGILLPQTTIALSIDELTVGDLGIRLILSYVIGNLVQAIGNILERVWWRLWGGWPTDWVRTGKRKFLSDEQRTLLLEPVSRMLETEDLPSISCYEKGDWASIVRQMHATIVMNGQERQIFVFNSMYGLNRGIAATFFLVAGAARVNKASISTIIALCTMGVLGILRMHKFGVLYAKELFAQYLALSGKV